MSNSLLTISMITNESLRELKNQLGFTQGVNRQYDDRFANEGAKIGSTINIRKPVRFKSVKGQALQIQNVDDQYVPLTLDQQAQVSFQFSSKDLTLSVDMFRERYIKPAVTQIANTIDYDGLQQYKNVYSQVGTPGTSPNSLLTYLQAKQKMYELGAPVDDNSTMLVTPKAQSTIVNALTGLFQSSDQIAKQYEKGMMGIGAGFKWKMDQNIASHTVGAQGGTPALAANMVEGATSIATSGWTAAVATRLNVGDIFSIAGVNAVNPQNRISTGSAAQFVVTAAVVSDGAGAATIEFQPPIMASGNYQNVDALPLSGALITVQGTSNIVGQANMAYHKDAFVLGCADLQMPNGVDMAARASDPDTGLSIRLVRDYDINNDQFPCRLDVLYGWKTVYPELACRVMG